MKIYGISGLGADSRVFQYLNLDCEFIPIDWINPLERESIEDYSKRLAELIDQNEKFGILGVSFGGLIATEMSKILKPELTILISSAETKNELRGVYNLIGKTDLVSMIPEKLFDLPRGIAYMLFGSNNQKLLNEILDDMDLRFTKWAIRELTQWKNEQRLTNCLKINGTKDNLIPLPKDQEAKLIEGGEHFMIVDRAQEISDLINDRIKITAHEHK